MASTTYQNGERVTSSRTQERIPMMGWLWSLIGLVLLAWLVALFIIGDDDAGRTTTDATMTAVDPAAVDATESD